MFWKKNKKKDLNSLSNKELEGMMEEFTEDGEKATLILQGRRNELSDLYKMAYSFMEQGFFSNSLDSINQYIKLSEQYGEVVKAFVFNLMMIDVENSKVTSEEIFLTYDKVIEYYQKKGCDELADMYKSKKADYEVTVNTIKEMQERYKFPLENGIIQALTRLESLKVNSYRDNSKDISFDAVWRSVLVQVDYYEQGEKGWNMLNKTTYKGAKNWLKSFAHLCKDDIPDEYKCKEG